MIGKAAVDSQKMQRKKNKQQGNLEGLEGKERKRSPQQD